MFGNLLRRQVGSRYPTVEYICRNTQILETLSKGYENPDISLFCGSMLRECARHEPLAKLLINSPNIWKFFKHVEQANFDLASDAFSTFRVRHFFFSLIRNYKKQIILSKNILKNLFFSKKKKGNSYKT